MGIRTQSLGFRYGNVGYARDANLQALTQMKVNVLRNDERILIIYTCRISFSEFIEDMLDKNGPIGLAE